MMQIIILNSIVDITLITFSEKGFGKFADKNAVEYQLTDNAKNFSQRFINIYNDCILELIRDDDVIGKFHPPYTGAREYPTLEELFLMNEPQRMELIDTYFIFDILQLYVKEDAIGSRVQWIITSIDSLLMQDHKISISGRVRPNILP